MMRSLYSGISGLKNHQTRMDVIGNNIANVNTIGFKTSRVVFQDIYSQTLRTGSAGITPAADGTGGMGGTNPAQIGLGVKLGSIDVIHTSAPTQRTDNPLDLAIDGDGYFIVRNPQTGTDYYSRAGNFRLDDKGNLVTSDGFFVMGYNMEKVYAPGIAKVPFIDSNGKATATSFSITPVLKEHVDNLNTLNDNANTATYAYNVAKAAEDAAAAVAKAIVDASAADDTEIDTALGTMLTDYGTKATDAATYVTDLDQLLLDIQADIDGGLADAASVKAIVDAFTTTDPTYQAECIATATAAAGAPNATAEDVQRAIQKVYEEAVNNSKCATAAKAAADKVESDAKSADDNAAAIEAAANGAAATYATATAPLKDTMDEAVAARKTVDDYIKKAIEAGVVDAVKTGDYTLPTGMTAANVAQGVLDLILDGTIKFDNSVLEDVLVATNPDKAAGLGPIDLSGYVSIAVDFDGTIYGIKDDIREPIAMLGVAMFANPSGLEKAGSSLYRKSGASGEPMETTPQQDGSGLINGGGLEMSNVDLAAEFTDMIVTQRGYQANSRIITVSDSMLEELVNLKR